MEGIEHSAYPCANAVVANDKPTIARVALAEPGRPNSRTDEVMVTSAIGCPGRVGLHVRSWRKPQPHPKAHPLVNRLKPCLV
jgi:hypothetical protein